jgi:aminocarboxymuconate-semialdehyde decarboxylase
MPIIDMHAHVTPERYKRAIAEGGTWHGLDAAVGELDRGAFAQPISHRISEMDATGVDIQLITPTAGFYQYGNDLAVTKVIARECNDEVAEIVSEHPSRFLGMGTVPMQDSSSAIEEMTRGVQDLGLKGVMISDHVAGRTYDEPEFLPFFKAAEELDAIVFFHQGGDTLVSHRIKRYKLANAVGNLTERTLVFAALVFGGVMDRCPGLKPLLAHAGGYTTFGAARMDKVAGAFEGAFAETGKLTPPFGPEPAGTYELNQPPSEYLSRFYYDCCTYSGPALRYVIDSVGIDRIVLGTDYPAPMYLIDAVNWVQGLHELSSEEKRAILAENASALLGVEQNRVEQNRNV